MVAQDIINLALKEIGVLSEGGTLTAEQANDALTIWNNLIDGWNAQRLQSFTVTRTTWTIVSSTQNYSVGTGQTVNVARPAFVDHINFQDTSVSPTLEYLMTPLTEDAWSKIPQKGLTAALPTSFYYNPTFSSATISLWPIPTSGTLQGVLYAPAVVPSFATLSTTVSLPPGYQRMYVKNLAIELCPSYEREPNPALVQAAQASLRDAKALNIRLLEMSCETGWLVQGRSQRWTYDIRFG